MVTLLLLGSSLFHPCLHGCLTSQACLCDVGSRTLNDDDDDEKQTKFHTRLVF